MIAPPVILVGTQRSGTTWLGYLLARHPDVAFWDEPRHVWTHGNARTPDDRLGAEHARPRVANWIRNAIGSYAERRGKTRFAEKTPSNCLRIPFIREVFPDARILLVIRDGRSVIRSTGEVMAGGIPTWRVLKRIVETPPWEWPAYAGKFVGVAKSKLPGAQVPYWGPRPPGWRDWLRDDDPDVVLAKQWTHTLGAAVRDLEGDPNHIRFRYEDAVREPRATLERLLDFAGLSRAPEVLDEAEANAQPETVDKWRNELDKGTLALVRPHLEPLLTELGYEW